MRIPLLGALGVAILGIVLGSFFDLQISQAIASPTNGFGLTISAIGPTIGFAGVAAMGGGFVALALKGQYHIALKVLFYILAACCLGVSIYYPGGEYFGINGFYGAAPKFVGYLIVIVPECAAMVGGYFLFKNCPNKFIWIAFISIIIILCIALLAVITGLKAIMHRPRYRLVSVSEVPFHNWWQPCKDYKEWIEKLGTNSDNFKSYPSGHTAEASILLATTTFLPLANEKFKKYQWPLFAASCALIVIVAFARILAAAHYLSDVSTGTTIIILLTLIDNEVLIRIKPLHQEEQTEQVEE